MNVRKSGRVRFFAGFVFAASISLASGNDLPEEIVAKLGAESFPQRVAAENELVEWLAAQQSKDWARLVETATDDEDPEVRIRAMKVLRQAVLGELSDSRPGFVGITMSAIQLDEETDEELGVQVLAVSPGSPAAKAGLKPRDVVVGLNGKGWENAEAQDEFASRVGSLKPGTEVTLEVLRNGKKREVKLTLAPRPWSAGEYGDMRTRTIDPFASRRRLPSSEKEAEDKVFRKWLEEHANGG